MPERQEGRFFWLLDKLVHREGIGDVLADGTYWQPRIGKGAEEYAHNTIKKHEQLPIKLAMLDPFTSSCIPPMRDQHHADRRKLASAPFLP